MSRASNRVESAPGRGRLKQLPIRTGGESPVINYSSKKVLAMSQRIKGFGRMCKNKISRWAGGIASRSHTYIIRLTRRMFCSLCELGSSQVSKGCKEFVNWGLESFSSAWCSCAYSHPGLVHLIIYVARKCYKNYWM